MATEGKSTAIRGVVGLITWTHGGYEYTAARIEGYTVRRSVAGQWTLPQATMVLSDAFKIRQRPLQFVAPHDGGQWRWPIEAIDFRTMGPNQIRAQLGAPLEETHGITLRPTGHGDPYTRQR